MQQIKLFKRSEAELTQLEEQINAWLAANPGRVINLIGNIAPQGNTTEYNALNPTRSPYSPSDVLIAVLYEKAK